MNLPRVAIPYDSSILLEREKKLYILTTHQVYELKEVAQTQGAGMNLSEASETGGSSREANLAAEGN